MTENLESEVPVEALTAPPRKHFFGYYEKSPWDAAERYVLAHRTSFEDRLQGVDDEAAILRIDTEAGNEAETVATTTAWCFQQGAMLQWLGPDYSERFVHNARANDGSFVAAVRDRTGDLRYRLSRPVYDVGDDGRTAFSLDFARLYHVRPGYGYAVPDAEPGDWAVDEYCPSDDGVYGLDVESDDAELLFSIEDAATLDPEPSMEGAVHWINHVQVAPGSERFACIHRWRPEEESGRRERLLVAGADGSDLRVLAGSEHVSHYDWKNGRELMLWDYDDGLDRAVYHVYDVETGAREPFAVDVLDRNGHNTYSPDGRWVLTDHYPDEERKRTLILYDTETGERHDIARFYEPPLPGGENNLRCDLHPRWDRSGERVCVDSKHTGDRQMYVLDVRSVVDSG